MSRQEPAVRSAGARATGALRHHLSPAIGLALSLTAALLASCGMKGPPRAPELVHPRPPEHLTARPSAEGIRLVWRRPTSYVDGTRMHDLASFMVERAPAERAAAPFARIGTVVVTDPVRFRADRRVEFLDPSARPGERYLYRVIALTADGYASEPAGPVRATRPAGGGSP